MLEVVAKAEVAQHFEEDEVPLGATYIVEVIVLSSSASTLLDTRRSPIRGCLVSGEVRLERHHAGNGEQHRWVVRNEARRRNHGVTALGEKRRPRCSEIVSSANRGARHGNVSLRDAQADEGDF